MLNRAILHQVHQLGKDKGKYLCALLYYSYFLCNALADPITYRIVPGQRFLSLRVRRNFHILAAILRSALGVPQPDTALTLPPDQLRDLRGKLEQFLDAAMKSKSMNVGDSMSLVYFLTLLTPLILK